MMAFFGYAVLMVFAVAQFMATRWLYRRTREASVPLGSFILFFWTLAGAWFFIGDSASGFQGYRIGLGYYYLMEKMFPFVLDANYLIGLLLYGSFLIGLFLALGRMLRSSPVEQVHARTPLHPGVLWLLGLSALLFSVILVLPRLELALAEGTSFYTALRSEPGRWYTLHTVANGVAAFSILIGYAIQLSAGAQGSRFKVLGSAWLRYAFPATAALVGLYLTVIGDRHTLLTMTLVSALYMLGAGGWPLIRRSALFFGLLAFALVVGGQLRGFSVQEVATLEQKEVDRSPFELPVIAHVPRRPEGLFRRTANAVLSNEMFAAHFSQYGILSHHVEPSPLVSFRYLGSSLVPSFLGGERTASAYDLYAKGTGLDESQGFTIHHAAAWYLNLGMIGPLVGGLLLGWFWGWTIRFGRRHATGIKAALLLLPQLFVAFLPHVLRNGPEGYRTLLIEGAIIPAALLAAAIFHGIRSERNQAT